MKSILFQLKFTLFFFLIVFFSCKDKTNSGSDQTMNKNEKEDVFIQINIDDLKLRNAPDLEANYTQILKKNEILKYLDDSTSFKTDISYKGEKISAPWYFVKTRSGDEGWIYAFFCIFLTEADNQKERLYLKNTTAQIHKDNDTQKKKKSALKVNTKWIQEYNYFISKLEKNKVSSVGKAINKFAESYANKINQATADKMFVDFIDFYEKVLNIQNKKDLSSYQHVNEELNRYQRSNMQSDDFTKSLAANGFNFAFKGNKVVIAPDLDFIYRIFYRTCSESMRKFMDQYQLETPSFWLIDNELMISLQELTEWILTWNYFIFKNPDFLLKDKAITSIRKELKIILDGTSKRKAFNQDDRLRDAFRETYEYIFKNFPASQIGSRFKAYYDILEENEFILNDETRAFKNDLEQEFGRY